MSKHKVSIVKYDNQRGAVEKALKLCGGLEKIKQLKPSDRVLLKPNLVMWDDDFAFPKYGVITTSMVMEEMVTLLAEHGVKHITIGEAGTKTTEAFAGLGYRTLQERYGVRLIDFNYGPFTEVNFGEFNLDFVTEALESDFLINLPVLKSHSSTKVSLGFKNLKGCLAKKSKKHCHHVNRALNNFVSHVGEKLYADITLIDGIYTLERGPVVNGTAHRADVLIASTDMFAADMVGSMAMGFAPAQIGHLAEYAQRHDLALHGGNIDMVGEPLSSVVKKLRWDWDWLEDNSGPPAFERMGIKGVNIPKYDDTICSTCSFYNNLILVLLMSAYEGKPYGNIELLSGKKRLSEGGYDKTILFGKCIANVNRDNPNIKEAVKIKGCPPSMEEIIKVLNEQGIAADEKHYRAYRQSLADRYIGKPEFDDSFYTVPEQIG